MSWFFFHYLSLDNLTATYKFKSMRQQLYHAGTDVNLGFHAISSDNFIWDLLPKGLDTNGPESHARCLQVALTSASSFYSIAGK